MCDLVIGGETAYDGTSTALTVTSQSSADINLTVEVEASSEDTDIALLSEAPSLAAESDAPGLYLALTVGEEEAVAVSAEDKVTVQTTIEGKDSNFEITVAEGEYVYQAKTGTEDAPITWNSADISLSGVVTKSTAKDLTAPTLTVTWKYEDPDETPAVTLSNATVNSTDDGVDYDVTFTKGTAKTCTFTGLGDGVTLSAVNIGTSASDISAATASVEISGAAFTIKATMWGSASAGDVKYIKVTASDGTIKVIKVTIA